jgi:hypothetical protein
LIADQDDTGADECCDGDVHYDGSGDGKHTRNGHLIPLGEALQRDLVDDPRWCREAPVADEAPEADRECPDGLEPWRTTSPGNSIGIG